MAVPDARYEFQIGGVWTDVTDDVKSAGKVTHTRGRPENSARVDSASATLIVKSPDGKYSNRNPLSPYYGLLPRNTLVRASVAGPSYLETKGLNQFGTGATTPDVAALDITGDIDIRFDATLSNWLASGSVELCGKGATTGNQRSWLLMMRDQRVFFEWSAAGTTTIQKQSTVAPAVPSNRRMAVRVTLDVDNGASGNTVTFYTAPTLAGPWTQLGDPVVTASTTALFNSSAALRVGDGWDDLGFPSSAGKVWSFELRSGIGGSVVANPDFTGKAAGTTSFADGTGKTWTVGASSAISDRHNRFVLSVPEWPPSWHVSGNDVRAELQAAGPLRRLNAGNKPLDSGLQRHIMANGALDCWPLTDGAQATRGNSLFGGQPMVPRLTFGTDPVQWASGTLADWTDPVVQLPAGTDGTLLGPAPVSTAAASGWSADLSVSGIKTGDVDFTIADRGAGSDADPRFIWYLALNRASNNVQLFCSSISESSSTSPLLATISTAGIYDTNPHHIRLSVVPGGSTTAWTVYIDGVSRATGTHSVVTKAARMLRPGWFLNGATDSTTALGYVTYWGPTAPSAASAYAALIGNQSETAMARVVRLCAENGISLVTTGVAADTAPMGPQRPDTLLTLLEECRDSDVGVLYEDREADGLAYRTRVSHYNQTPALTIPYGQLAPPLTPVDDENGPYPLRNDFTVTRVGGAWGRAVVEDGPLGVDTVGLYDEAVSRSLYSDDQPEQLAGWLAHLGTWDESRYPSVRLYLHKAENAALIPAVLALSEGDIIRITNLPSFLPPGPVDLMVMGYREEIGPFLWDLTLFCTPAGPWTVAVESTARLDTAGCVTNGSTSSSSSVLNVNTSVGLTRWADSATYPAEFPFDLYVGGEVMRATTCTGTALSQTFSVTRSINGVVKAHASGTPVQLATPPIAAL